MSYGTFLNPQHINEQETYTFEVYKKVKGNTAYQYEDVPSLVFKGRPASRLEKKTYRVVKGVNSAQNSVTIYASNLPNDIQPEDRVTYLGRVMIVKSVGYFVEDANYINGGIFDEKTLLDRFPKGITLT